MASVLKRLPGAGAGRMRYGWLVAVFALVVPVYFAWTWTDQLGAFGNDGPSYLMMARHYSPYHATDAVYTEAAAVSRFPPLYPLILAWSGAGADLHWVHVLTTAFLLAALGAFYAWLRVLGTALPQSALLVLLIAALPGTWRLGLSVQSEYPYLLFSLLALALLSAHAVRRRDELLYCAALAVGAAVLTRTLGVALYIPLALAAARSRRRAACLALAAGTLPLLAWHLLHRADFGYGGVLSGVYGRHLWNAIRDQLLQEMPALRHGFESDLSLGGALAQIAADALGALCLTAALWRCARLKPDALYIVPYGAVLLLWPFPEEAWRFIWAILPVLLAQPLLLLAQIRQEPLDAAGPQRATAAMAAVLLALALPEIARASGSYLAAPFCGLPQARGLSAWYEPGSPGLRMHRVFSQVVITDALRRVRDEVPENECVISIRPDLVNYFAERRSAYTPNNSVPDPLFLMAMRRTGCRYVFMSTATIEGSIPPLHPLQRLGDQIHVLDYVSLPDPPPGDNRVSSMLAELP